jgi:hypothetical protein
VSNLPAVSVDFHPAGNRYSQEMVDWCYQVWALKANRSPTKTHRLVSDEKFRDLVGMVLDEDIPDRSTIEYWSKQYKWMDRFQNDLEVMGGAIIYQAKADVIFALGETAAFLRDTVNNSEEQTHNRIKAGELLMSYGMGKDSGSMSQPKPRSESDIDPEKLKDLDTGSLLEMIRDKAARRNRRG